MTNSKSYFKYCLVPLCKSTTVQTPDKIFFNLPENPKRRAKWLNACKRNKSISEKSKALHVCEDHFNLAEDMENYLKYKLVGGQKKMKSSVVPHIFYCHSGRKRLFNQTVPPLTAPKSLVDTAIVSTSTSYVANTNVNEIQAQTKDTTIRCTNLHTLDSERLEKTHTSTQTCIKFRSICVQVDV